MPQFDVTEQLEKDETATVKLQDGTVCRSVVVTPVVRRELRKIDRELTEKTETLRRTQLLQGKANDGGTLDDADFDAMRESLDVVDDVGDAVYRKLQILLRTVEDDTEVELDRIQSMGDKIANRLYRLITIDTEGNDSPAAIASPNGTTTTS